MLRIPSACSLLNHPRRRPSWHRRSGIAIVHEHISDPLHVHRRDPQPPRQGPRALAERPVLPGAVPDGASPPMAAEPAEGLVREEDDALRVVDGEEQGRRGRPDAPEPRQGAEGGRGVWLWCLPVRAQGVLDGGRDGGRVVRGHEPHQCRAEFSVLAVVC